MRRVLFSLPAPSLAVCLGVILVLGACLGGWYLWQRRRGAATRDHLYLAFTILGFGAILLLVLSRLSEIRVYGYGTMLVTGFIAGTLAAVRLGRRRGIPAERLLDLGLWILIGAIIGARVVYLLITPNAGPLIETTKSLSMGGLSFHGGLIGGFLAGSLYIVLAKLNYWRVADSLAPGIAVGYALTRIGCFLNGCCYGKSASGLPWAMNFPDSPDGPLLHVHPTQLYASLMGFAMFAVLLLLSRGRSLGRAGRLFMAFLMMEGVERFVMEIYRQPDPTIHGVITPAQFVSILVIALGIVGWFVLPKRPAVDAVPATTPNAREQLRTAR